MEKPKIECTIKLFNEMSDDTVRYGVADNYQSLLHIINDVSY